MPSRRRLSSLPRRTPPIEDTWPRLCNTLKSAQTSPLILCSSERTWRTSSESPRCRSLLWDRIHSKRRAGNFHGHFQPLHRQRIDRTRTQGRIGPKTAATAVVCPNVNSADPEHEFADIDFRTRRTCVCTRSDGGRRFASLPRRRIPWCVLLRFFMRKSRRVKVVR